LAVADAGSSIPLLIASTAIMCSTIDESCPRGVLLQCDIDTNRDQKFMWVLSLLNNKKKTGMGGREGVVVNEVRNC
jgi:hypothetical protein